MQSLQVVLVEGVTSVEIFCPSSPIESEMFIFRQVVEPSLAQQRLCLNFRLAIFDLVMGVSSIDQISPLITLVISLNAPSNSK